MMKVVKVVNNNIITSLDDNQREIILTGRGLGFGVKKGEEINADQVEKIFSLSTPAKNERLLSIIQEIPIEHLEVADLVIEHAKERLGDKLKDTIYLSLIDHMNCAIERLHAGTMFANPLLWDIKQYYPDEFQAALESIALIKKETEIKFPIDEAGFIALHFITSEYETSMDVTVDITKMIRDTVKMVEEYFNASVDKQSIHYERFVTHLKFFIARVMNSKQIPDEEEMLFREMIQQKYKDCYQCVLKIKEKIESEYHVKIGEDEIIYLTVHIRRITLEME